MNWKFWKNDEPEEEPKSCGRHHYGEWKKSLGNMKIKYGGLYPKIHRNKTEARYPMFSVWAEKKRKCLHEGCGVFEEKEIWVGYTTLDFLRDIEVYDCLGDIEYEPMNEENKLYGEDSYITDRHYRYDYDL